MYQTVAVSIFKGRVAQGKILNYMKKRQKIVTYSYNKSLKRKFLKVNANVYVICSIKLHNYDFQVATC